MSLVPEYRLGVVQCPQAIGMVFDWTELSDTEIVMVYSCGICVDLASLDFLYESLDKQKTVFVNQNSGCRGRGAGSHVVSCIGSCRDS